MSEKMKFLEEIRKHKNESRLAVDVAEELAGLAEELAKGQITISGETLSVSDTFSFFIKKQFKKGVVSCDIFLQSRPATDKKNPADAVVVSLKASAREKTRAPGGKKLKKEIALLWKEAMKQVAEGIAPAPATVRELLRRCEDYNLCADKQWFDSWRQCSDEIKACLAAAGKGDFPTAREKVALVNRLTKECHKLYK